MVHESNRAIAVNALSGGVSLWKLDIEIHTYEDEKNRKPSGRIGNTSQLQTVLYD